ncbi:hypothetical protein AHIS2_p072 [Acaryochloris phage A-HIS2]|nr:hypothetical protein AHIS2_p072 [Acaryochloris phage A-HIS2]
METYDEFDPRYEDPEYYPDELGQPDPDAPGITHEALEEFLEACGATVEDLQNHLGFYYGDPDPEPVDPIDFAAGCHGVNGVLYELASYALGLSLASGSYSVNSQDRSKFARASAIISEAAAKVDEVIL